MQRQKRAIHIIAATLFTLVIIALALNYLSLDALKSSFGRVNMGLVAATVGIYLIITTLRGLRFIAAGAKLSKQNAFIVAAVHSALLRVMPLRSGELAYGILLKRMGGGGFTEGMASILMLRILDLAAVLPLGAALAASLLSDSKSGLSMTALLATGAALLLIYFSLKPLSRAILKRAPIDPETGLPSFKSGIVSKVVSAIVKAFDLPLSRQIGLLGLTIVMWSFVLAWLDLCIMSMGAVGAFRDGFTTSLLGVLGSVLPISLLGSFGPMESGFAIGLTLLGETREAAVAGSIVISAITFIDCWAIGLPAWLVLLVRSVGSNSKSASADEKPIASKSLGGMCDVIGGVVFSLAGAMLLVKRIGYFFETNDQFQYFLLPYRSIFDDFLVGDWFTWQTSHYHVVFSWLIRLVHAVTGPEGFAYGIFALHFLVLFGISYGLWKLAGAMKWHWIAAAFALLIVAFVRHTGIAGAIVNHGMLLPADMAFAPFLLGLAAWLEGRYVGAGLWLGLSGLAHANFAVLGPLLIAPVEIHRLIKERDWKRTAKMAVGYLILAWPTLLVVVKSFLLPDNAPGALDVMFKIRSPHHYDPSFAEASDLFWIAALLIAGLPVWMAGGKEKAQSGGIGLLIVLTVSQILAWVATALGVGSLIRLFFWRLSIPFILLAAMAVGEVAVRSFRSLKFEKLLYAAAALFVVSSFSCKGYVRIDPELELGGFGLTAPCLVAFAAAAVFISFLNTRLSARIIAAALGAAVLCWCVLISIPGQVVSANKSLQWGQALDKWSDFKPISVKESKPGRNDAIYSWIKKNTSKSSVFLAPPGLDDFRLKTGRGVFVDWKCCPMKGDEVLEWKRRMLAEMGTDDFPAKGYALHGASNKRYFSRPLKYLADLARKEKLTHIMAESRPQAAQAGLKKLFVRGRLAVYQVE